MATIIFYILISIPILTTIGLLAIGFEQGIKQQNTEDEYISSARWIDGK